MIAKKKVGRPKGPEPLKQVSITAPESVWALFSLLRRENECTQAKFLERLLEYWRGN